MKPSGDFVVMEAKELVKLFDANGNAAKGAVLQPMTTPGTNQVPLQLGAFCLGASLFSYMLGLSFTSQTL